MWGDQIEQTYTFLPQINLAGSNSQELPLSSVVFWELRHWHCLAILDLDCPWRVTEESVSLEREWWGHATILFAQTPNKPQQPFLPAWTSTMSDLCPLRWSILSSLNYMSVCFCCKLPFFPLGTTVPSISYTIFSNHLVRPSSHRFVHPCFDSFVSQTLREN